MCSSTETLPPKLKGQITENVTERLSPTSALMFKLTMRPWWTWGSPAVTRIVGRIVAQIAPACSQVRSGRWLCSWGQKHLPPASTCTSVSQPRYETRCFGINIRIYNLFIHPTGDILRVNFLLMYKRIKYIMPICFCKIYHALEVHRAKTKINYQFWKKKNPFVDINVYRIYTCDV